MPSLQHRRGALRAAHANYPGLPLYMQRTNLCWSCNGRCSFSELMCGLCNDMSTVLKLGTWGGDGGVAHDITVAPQRLESITIRNGKVIDFIAFSYRDRDKQVHTAGPWGGTGGTDERTITLDASEYVTEVAGAIGPIGDVPRVITSLKIVTNRATYGPFGQGYGTPFNIPVLNNGSIVGMFARATDYLDAIGFYIRPF